jgi:hypothetical protein
MYILFLIFLLSILFVLSILLFYNLDIVIRNIFSLSKGHITNVSIIAIVNPDDILLIYLYFFYIKVGYNF